MMNFFAPFITISLASIFSCAHLEAATLIADQEQSNFERLDDVNLSGESGQTFTADVDGLLAGIRLFVAPRGSEPRRNVGSDFIVSLQTTTNGVPTTQILTTGEFSRSRFEPDDPRSIINSDETREIIVLFDTPYQQSTEEVLAFTILETSGGGRDGYNVYGNVSGDIYESGQQFFSFTEGDPLQESDRDLAFETLISVPEPSIPVLGGTILLASFCRRRRVCEDPQ